MRPGDERPDGAVYQPSDAKPQHKPQHKKKRYLSTQNTVSQSVDVSCIERLFQCGHLVDTAAKRPHVGLIVVGL